MKNFQISSSETDRKIARPASVIFMALAWLGMAGLLFYILLLRHSEYYPFTIWDLILIGLFLVPLVLIPIQIVRYFRQKRP